LVDEAAASLFRRLGGSLQSRRLWIFALGKAAGEMAHAAVDAARIRGATVTGGVVVAAEDVLSPHPEMRCVVGDHPIPGARSLSAAQAIEAATRRVGEADAALVLISGGTTSLVAAPVNGLPADTLPALFEALHRSGWDIAAMNGVRKRFLRWGAGRLAGALAPAIIQPALLSDVIGDDPASIASGPCVADALSARDVRDRLDALDTLPRETLALLVRHLDAVIDGTIPETPKPEDRMFGSVLPSVVRGNATALDAAAAHARRLDWQPITARHPLTGEAAHRGAQLAAALVSGVGGDRPFCIIHGGETTVTLGNSAIGRGGRCQELALAAARALDRAHERAETIALLAAGTDGRDGPTDAAGAVIDRDTWRQARSAGRDPEADLANHDAYGALDAARALLRTGPTGTNVMDLVVGVVDVRR
jgi:hydroxypyruvate reductase